MEDELDVIQQVGLAEHEEMNQLLRRALSLYSSMGKRATFAVEKLLRRDTAEALDMKRAGFVYFLMYNREMQQAACAGRFGDRNYHPMEPDHLRQFIEKLAEVRRDYVCRIPGPEPGNRPQDTARRFMDVVRASVESGGVRGCVEMDNTLRTTIDESWSG